MRRSPVLLAGLLLGTAIAAPAHAQQLSIGGFIGQIYDTSEDWLLFGAEARWQIKDGPFVVQPRFWINPYEGGSALVLEGNLLYRPDTDGKVRLYGGVGGGMVRTTFEGADSQTKAAFNFVAGVEIILKEESKLRPFAHTQYNVMNDAGNVFTLSAGVAFRLK